MPFLSTVIAVLLVAIGVVDVVVGQSTIVADGDTTFPALSYATIVTNGLTGAGIQLSPDPWHSPAITFSAPLWRANFQQFSSINLDVVCPTTAAPLTIKFQRWTATGVGGNSNNIYLANYVISPLSAASSSTGSVNIGSTWAKVSIPISAFTTPDWNLNGVERIYFNLDSSSRKCIIDNVILSKSGMPSLLPTAVPSTLSPTTSRPSRSDPADWTTRLSSAWGIDPIFDGEIGSFPLTTTVDFAALVEGSGVLGTAGLELRPDPWHSPALTLSSPLYRTDVGRYRELLMFVRCQQDDTPLTMKFSRWTADGTASSSKAVAVGTYAEPADTPTRSTIGTVWTKVRIPIPDFFAADWQLNGAERIYFNLDSQSRKCWVDNLYVWTEKVPSVAPTPSPSLVPTPAPSTSRPTRIESLDTTVILEEVLGVQPAFDGEYNSFRSRDIRYAEAVNGTGVFGSVGLELHPDPWHSPVFLLSDPLYRSDIAQYNEILLYVRCAQDDTPISMHFGRWTANKVGGTSAKVNLANYAEPRDDPIRNTIDRRWTKVRIPITAFFTSDWTLAGAEWIYFNSDVQYRKCYIDNVLFRENIGPHITEVRRMTDSIVRIEMNKYYEHTSARTLSNYEIQEVHMIDGQSTVTRVFQPESIGLFSRFQKFKDNSLITKSIYYIHLILPERLDCSSSTKSYVVKMANVTDPAMNPMNTTVWEIPCAGPVETNTIKVNQVGYLPERQKLAYISEYYGDNDGGVWVVGKLASIWHWNRIQGSFRKMSGLPSSIATITLRGVTANNNKDVWAVGDQGTIVHYNGFIWSVESSPTTKDLYAIEFAPDRSVAYAVGNDGTILKFVPNIGDSKGTWIAVTNSPTTNDLRTIWLGSSIMWVGGASGTILRKVPPSRSIIGNSVSTTSTDTWAAVKPLTDQTIIAIEGVRTDGAISAICSGGLLLKNQWGSWIKDTQLNDTMNTYFMNPTYLKTGRGFGNSGLGLVLTDTDRWSFDTKTTVDLTASAMVEERIAFAFGRDGSCIQGSTLDNKPWSACQLPDAQEVTAAVSVIEGPLRLPFPRPSASLQLQLPASGEWITLKQYPVQLQTMNYRLSAEDVFIINFSDATMPGTYRILVDGLGTSRIFKIGSDALNIAAYHTCRMMYYQRSGMPNGLETPYAEERFTRPIDHEFNTSVGGRKIDGAFHWSIASSPLYDNEVICPLKTKNCPAESYRDGSGGWFDAGDYSKYMSTATPTVWKLLVTLEILQSEGLPLHTFNIPESNNGIPDLLNEATWGIKWMMKMQKENDGGVFNKLASEMWEYDAPEKSDLGGQYVRFFLPRTTHDTATAGAIFAQASRFWKTYNTTFSAVLRRRAELAWQFLEDHPTTTPVGGFVNPPGHVSGPYPDVEDSDNRAWTAAELYRLTCDSKYGDRYVSFIAAANNVVAMGGNDFVDFRLQAAWAFYYSSCPNEPTTYTKTRQYIREAFYRNAYGGQSRTLSNTYRNIGRTDVPEWIGWGSFTLSYASIWGVLGWHVFKDPAHLDWMTLSMDTVLGANPLGMSFVTGLGYVYPMDPTQGQSRTDNVVEPLPGYVVMGPYAHVSFMSPYFAAAQGNRANYPYLTQLTSPFPILRRWSDDNTLPQYN